MAFASFGHYLKAKREKLIHQQETQGTLFSGIKLYFNGVDSHWKELAIANGATTIDYLDSTVNIIIASQMTMLKMSKIRIPVLKPSWIQDSIDAGRKQDYKEYFLYTNGKQKTLSLTKRKPDLNLDDPRIQKQICTYPGFIDTYFESSRLHHLSTQKQELIYKTRCEMEKRHHVVLKEIQLDSIILHVDMDCYFASVMLKKYPEYKNKPVVVSHATGDGFSSADVASCNYIARKFGIKNGSIIGNCKELIPDLVVLPYDFQLIRQMTEFLYEILYENSDFVQAISCDEAYIDITNIVKQMGGDPLQQALHVAEMIRQLIFVKTECTASIGIGSNPLTARIATNKAKPDGVFLIHEMNLQEIIGEMDVKKLPGVGYATVQKCHSLNIVSVSDLLNFDLQELKDHFGEKHGVSLFLQARGKDSSSLENKVQNTVGAEINWAIRFRNEQEYCNFIKEFSHHVYKRMIKIGLNSRYITVTAKKRNYVGEPSKFLGHGHCIDFSKSVSLEHTIVSEQELFEKSWKAFKTFDIDPIDIRGIGIHLKKEKDLSQPRLKFKRKFNAIQSPTPKKVRFEQDFKAHLLPSLSQINQEVFDQLPPSIQQEQRDYAIRKRRVKEWAMEHLAPHVSKIDSSVLKCLPVEVRHEQLQLARNQVQDDEPVNVPIKDYKPQLLGMSNLDTIREWISDWVHNCKTELPSENDVEYLCTFFTSLIEMMEIHYLGDLLGIIYRGFHLKNGKSNMVLQDTFTSIVTLINMKMMEQFGGPLYSQLYLN